MQGRNLRRFDKLCWQKGAAAEYARALKGETERLRRESLAVRAYLDHFLSNVWRTIHEEPKDKWPGIFGKLYSDHFQGARAPCGRASTARAACLQERPPASVRCL